MGRMPATSSLLMESSETSTLNPLNGSDRAFIWVFLAALAAVVGLLLMADSIRNTSATYDEVAYLRVAARWWRTGQQAEITRMGSPLLFWKLQQAPVLWVLDRSERGYLIDEPIRHQAVLLPLVRAGALWIWLVALGLTAWWSRKLYGPRAMALAAWLFAVSPNLLAHGALVTMELPLLASLTATFFLFWKFLVSNAYRWLLASALAAGVAFSCKYTAVLVPAILGAVWWLDRARANDGGLVHLTRRVVVGMSLFLVVMLAANFVATDFATLPLSGSRGHHPSIAAKFGGWGEPLLARLYELPIPQDWVGFATQLHHQASGGSSYLLGERRMTGWWYYYFVALTVKVPLTFWLLTAGRLAMVPRLARFGQSRDWTFPLIIGLFLTITAIGSSRNYGFRYLLPLAPLAIVWVSALAENLGEWSGRRWRFALIGVGLTGQILAVATSHPHELTYFHSLVGGPKGGRQILSDSNLDWGQGLRSLARLQRDEPAYRDLTIYYFGDTEPSYYGVEGTSHVVNAVDDHSRLPGLEAVRSSYLAVSASLQWGPWGPAGFFQVLNRLSPARMTDDTTIAIYRTSDLSTLVQSSRRRQ